MIPLLILVAIPLVEIAVLFKVGQSIGFWWTFALVVATFMLGAGIVGQSGFASAVRVREALSRGEPPVAAMLESALLVVAGVLLMTPGLVADVLGLVLLIPPVRAWLAVLALRKFVVVGDVHVRQGTSGMRPDSQGPSAADMPKGDGPIIDGEFQRLDERPVDPKRRSEGGSSP